VVSCSSSQNCNESTGLLLIAQEDGPHGCTASLIGADILLTRSECVPEALRSANADCSGTIWIKFPAMEGLAAESEECSSVLKSTAIVDGASNQVDYAFLKLKSAPHRIPLALNFSGMNDQENFYVYKFDFAKDASPITGTMSRESCLSVQNSMILPTFNRALAPLATLSGCDLKDGNGGAPVVDERGQLHGLIQAPAVSTIESTFLSTYLLSSSYNAIELATNLACMTSHEALPNHSADPSCTEVETDSKSPSSNLRVRLQPELDAEKSNLQGQVVLAGLSAHVQWGEGYISADASELSADLKAWGKSGAVGMAPVPLCIWNLSSWIQSYSDGALGMKRSADESVTLPVSVFRLGLNADEVPDFQAVRSLTVQGTLHFNPQEVFHKKSGTFELHSTSRAGADETLFSSSLGECSSGPTQK
jgi:hypothetical protein